jgi:hypothetical protein
LLSTEQEEILANMEMKSITLVPDLTSNYKRRFFSGWSTFATIGVRLVDEEGNFCREHSGTLTLARPTPCAPFAVRPLIVLFAVGAAAGLLMVLCLRVVKGLPSSSVHPLRS